MDTSIEDVARLSGVTARTLRHYDAIGLLRATSIGADGHRRYDDAALLRLQHVLVLRALDVPLRRIAEVLTAARAEEEVLAEHLLLLRAERDRLGRMADTVARTLEDLQRKGDGAMTVHRPENLFEGFDHRDHADEARERWPEEAASSEAFAATLTEEDSVRLQQQLTAHLVRVADLRAAGHDAGSPAVQAEIDWLHGTVSRMWTPDAAAFTALGAMYVEDERYRATYDRVAPGLAEFVRDGMAVYARTRLA